MTSVVAFTSLNAYPALGRCSHGLLSDNPEIFLLSYSVISSDNVIVYRKSWDFFSLCFASQDLPPSPLFRRLYCFTFTYSEFHLYLSVAQYQEVLQNPYHKPYLYYIGPI